MLTYSLILKDLYLSALNDVLVLFESLLLMWTHCRMLMYLSILKDSHLSSHLTMYFHLLSHSLIDVDALSVSRRTRWIQCCRACLLIHLLLIDALSDVDVLADSDNFLLVLADSLRLMRYQTSTYSLILITSACAC